MRRLRIVGLAVAAGLVVGSGVYAKASGGATAQLTPSQVLAGAGAPTQDQGGLLDEAPVAEEVPAPGPGADPAGGDASALALPSGLCYTQTFSDPNEAADTRLDATSYEMGYDCVNSRFVAGVTTVDSWAANELLEYYVHIDTDGNLTNGCYGADYVAGIYWDPDRNAMVGGLYRLSAPCGRMSDATFLSSVVFSHPAGNQIWFGFSATPFRNVPTMRWQQAIDHVEVNEEHVDYLPDGFIDNGNFRSTPGNVCNGRCFYLTNVTTGGSAQTVFRDPEPASQILIGDWNNDNVDSFGFRSGNTYKLKNTHAPGAPALTFSYGRADDTVLIGDWNGDGIDTLAVRRGNTYYMRNSFGSGPAEITVSYGRPDDVVLVGDWNGDGKDTLAVRRGNTYYLKNSFSSGPADITVAYGRAGDTVLVGDWDGDGDDTLAVRRSSTYYLKNTFSSGAADITFSYGTATDITFVGDWNADNKDTLGVRR